MQEHLGYAGTIGVCRSIWGVLKNLGCAGASGVCRSISGLQEHLGYERLRVHSAEPSTFPRTPFITCVVVRVEVPCRQGAFSLIC